MPNATDTHAASSDPNASAIDGGTAFGVSIKSGVELSVIPPWVIADWLENLADMVGQANWSEALQLAMLVNANSSSHARGNSPNGPEMINGGGAPGGTQASNPVALSMPQTDAGSNSPLLGGAQNQTSPFVYTDFDGGSSTAALAQSSSSLGWANPSPDFGTWADLLDPNRPSAQTTLSSSDALNGVSNLIAASSLVQNPMGPA